tara:strand:+ start:124 stop:297 length:174 start_codon:yes stop_codon:yes gene_type:complete
LEEAEVAALLEAALAVVALFTKQQMSQQVLATPSLLPLVGHLAMQEQPRHSAAPVST